MSRVLIIAALTTAFICGQEPMCKRMVLAELGAEAEMVARFSAHARTRIHGCCAVMGPGFLRLGVSQHR